MIGINGYKDMGKLKNAVNDARAIKEALEKEGVVVFYAENCTIAQLNEIVQLYLGSLQEGEVTLVFFAGHGVEFANANRLLAISESDVTDYKRDSLNLLLLLLRCVAQSPVSVPLNENNAHTNNAASRRKVSGSAWPCSTAAECSSIHIHIEVGQ